MQTPTIPDTRQATCWLNYPGKVVPDPFRPLGPNLLGELLWPIEVTRDEQANTTRVGFSLIAPPGTNPFAMTKTGKAVRA